MNTEPERPVYAHSVYDSQCHAEVWPTRANGMTTYRCKRNGWHKLVVDKQLGFTVCATHQKMGLKHGIWLIKANPAMATWYDKGRLSAAELGDLAIL